MKMDYVYHTPIVQWQFYLQKVVKILPSSLTLKWEQVILEIKIKNTRNFNYQVESN